MHMMRKFLTVIATASLTCVGVLGVSTESAHAVGTPKGKTAAQAPIQISANKWSVRSTFFGKNGEDVPLRNGDSNFGYAHIQQSHPINDYSLHAWIDDALEDGTYKKDRDKVTARVRTATGKMFRVVFTERVDSASRDGRPVGIITAFLE